MKKQKIYLTIILLFAMLLTILVPLQSFADDENKITFDVSSNTNVYNIGENFDAEIRWDYSSGVQAVGFTLQYDANKLQFIDATYGEHDNGVITKKTLQEDFYNTETPGTIILSQISLNDLNLYGINFKFKTIAQGSANLNISNVDCVADGNLVSPDIIDFTTNGTLTEKILLFGDVDSNGKVENADITLINNYIKGTQELTEQQLEIADVNLDGVVDEIDLGLIEESIASSITLPIRYGDVNLDGFFGMPDLIRLAKYLSGEIELSSQALKNADINLDGMVNEIDINSMNIATVNWIQLPFRMIKNANLKAVDKGDTHILTGFDTAKTKVSDLSENFYTDKGFEILNNNNEALDNNAIYGTGTKVKIGHFNTQFPNFLHEGEKINWLAEYNVVIYGDTTGDSKINAIDALALIKHLNGAIPFTSEVFTEAGRIVAQDGADPTAVDALAIIKHANKKITISQTK